MAGPRGPRRRGSPEACRKQAAEGRPRGCCGGKAEAGRQGGRTSSGALASSCPAPRDQQGCGVGQAVEGQIPGGQQERLGISGQGRGWEGRGHRQRWATCGPGPACPAELRPHQAPGMVDGAGAAAAMRSDVYPEKPEWVSACQDTDRPTQGSCSPSQLHTLAGSRDPQA